MRVWWSIYIVMIVAGLRGETPSERTEEIPTLQSSVVRGASHTGPSRHASSRSHRLVAPPRPFPPPVRVPD